jgi:cytochrome c biogenesis protein CcmG/thiol:disulfide interchange protein DsbE
MDDKRKPLIYAVLIIVAVVAGYFVYENFLAPKPIGVVGINAGNLLKDETIPNIDGIRTVKFSDYRGKVLVVDFMAPWCEPCKEMIPILQQVDAIDGVEVVTVNVDPNYGSDYLTPFGAQEGITWYFGSSPSAALDYDVSGIPTILIVDKDGMIVYRNYFTTIQQFDMYIPQLLG